jgi:hypothetical protein
MADTSQRRLQKAKTVSRNVDRCRRFDSRRGPGFFIREIGVEDERSTCFQLPNVSRKMSAYELPP